MKIPSQLAVPCQWTILISPCLCGQVNLKFHRGGNFGIFLWTLPVNLTFQGVGGCISPYLGEHSKSTWSSTEVVYFEISLALRAPQVNFSAGCGNLDVFLYTLVDKSNQPEVPRGGILISACPREHSKSTCNSMGVGIWISSHPCGHLQWIGPSMEVETCISSYPCEHSKSNWSSAGVGILISYHPCYPCEHSKSTWSSTIVE